MDKQISLSALNDELAQVRTKKKEFLEQMDRIIPWGEWIALIQPCYYEGERGNKPYKLELMLRLFILQSWKDQCKARRQWGKHKPRCAAPTRVSENIDSILARLRADGFPVQPDSFV